jgi:hypothetical protein
MNRPETYHKSVQILYDAYFNDTLEHERCSACAVSNLLQEASVKSGIKVSRWSQIFCTISSANRRGPKQHLIAGENEILGETVSGGIKAYNIDNNKECKVWREEAFTLFSYSDYTLEELIRIENVFESADAGLSDEDWMFNGLVDVLNALKQIHEVTDEDLIQANHKRFKDHHERKLQTV